MTSVEQAWQWVPDLAIRVPANVFDMPPARHRRGRRPKSEKQFPDGTMMPSRDDLMTYVLSHVLVQWDESFDGPVFCKLIASPHNAKARGDRITQIVLGPPRWSGAWTIAAGKDFAVQAFWVPSIEHWIPRLLFQNGNVYPISNLNGFDRSAVSLRSALIKRRLVTAEEYDRYVHPLGSVRAHAISSAVPALWM